MSISPRVRQVVDWSAAIWAGLIAGLVFLVLNMFFLPAIAGSTPWVIVRYFAHPILGKDVLIPPLDFHIPSLVVGILLHMVLSVLFALLIAFIIHRWGLIVGFLGGAALGLAIYLINFYTMTYIFPLFFILHGWTMMLNHVIFGALAGGIYEALEVETFILVED